MRRRRRDIPIPRGPLAAAGTAAALALAGGLLGCDTGRTKYIGGDFSIEGCLVTPTVPPATLGLDSFYRKYLDGNGIPVLASEQPDDIAVRQACLIVVHMLSKSRPIREAAIAAGLKAAVIGRDEVTTDIPEHRDLYQAFPGQDWDNRTRGVGATNIRPVSSCGEENLLCLANDPLRGEFVLVQSFSHGVRSLGIGAVDDTFPRRLDDTYRAALNAGLWRGTFAETEPGQYFAEGVQSWFNTNGEASPPDGNHNEVNTRTELRAYDRRLADLIAEYFPDDDWTPACP